MMKTTGISFYFISEKLHTVIFVLEQILSHGSYFFSFLVFDGSTECLMQNLRYLDMECQVKKIFGCTYQQKLISKHWKLVFFIFLHLTIRVWCKLSVLATQIILNPCHHCMRVWFIYSFLFLGSKLLTLRTWEMNERKQGQEKSRTNAPARWGVTSKLRLLACLLQFHMPFTL